MYKKHLSEHDICTKFITPTIQNAGWRQIQFRTNCDAFLLHDRTGITHPIESELSLEEFPSYDDLWAILSGKKRLGCRSPAKTLCPSLPHRMIELPEYDRALVDVIDDIVSDLSGA